jgi:arylsulfatase A-like enzyme
MNRRRFLHLTLVGGAAAAARLAKDTQRTNIVFMLMDDLGWHDVGPNGNQIIDTPNLDRFNTQSARFTNAYAACPVCSPTRASIMTGKYPARLHLTDWIPGRKQWPYARLLTPQFELQLPLSEVTLAEMVRLLGYRSAAIGKWHLGGEGHAPTDQGFDVNVGGGRAGSPRTYFGPETMTNLTLEQNESLTDRLAFEGARFIQESKGKSFFLYESQYTVHIPLEARADKVAKYRKKNTGDVDPTYCAMVENADESVGRLLKTLDETGQAGNTIVVFFSDNGGVRYQSKRAKTITNNTPFRAGKGHLFEGGIREPLLIRWPGVTKGASVIDTPVSSVDFVPTFCEALGIREPENVDGVSIRPLLEGKRIAERPLFWHYPHYSDQGGKPAGAVRLGRWKLIEFYEDNHLELFDLESDPGERRNLLLREPAKAKALHERLKAWRLSVKASMPKPNPDYDPARASEGLTGYEAATPPLPA